MFQVFHVYGKGATVQLPDDDARGFFCLLEVLQGMPQKENTLYRIFRYDPSSITGVRFANAVIHNTDGSLEGWDEPTIPAKCW